MSISLSQYSHFTELGLQIHVKHLHNVPTLNLNDPQGGGYN